MDSVHQGDLDNVKGVYHVNAVDQVLQYQFTGCVKYITEHYLLPVLERLLVPFPVLGCKLSTPAKAPSTSTTKWPRSRLTSRWNRKVQAVLRCALPG